MSSACFSRIPTAAKYSACSSPIGLGGGERARGRYRDWGCALGASYERKCLEQEGRGASELKPIKEFKW